MAEGLSADLQATLNAILANIQSVRDENNKNIQAVRDDNKQLREDNKILQENLKIVREDSKRQNKKIFAAIHEQAKQSKAIVEAAESKITEKVESIRGEFETAIALNNTRVTECETRVLAVEEHVNDSINTCENKLEI